jgi:hypothetical protein
MTLIYKPFGLIVGLAAGMLGKKAFEFVWAKIDDEEPPEATTLETSWPKLMIAAALQGMIFMSVRVAVNRYGALGWYHLTGNWPGERRPERD